MSVVKPALPGAVAGIEVKIDGKFQRVWSEQQVSRHGSAMQSYERSRILGLLDDFAQSCQQMAKAMADQGVGDPYALSAQLDAVRLLQEAINHPPES